jgi:hypothetical protein
MSHESELGIIALGLDKAEADEIADWLQWYGIKPRGQD